MTAIVQVRDDGGLIQDDSSWDGEKSLKFISSTFYCEKFQTYRKLERAEN